MAGKGCAASTRPGRVEKLKQSASGAHRVCRGRIEFAFDGDNRQHRHSAPDFPPWPRRSACRRPLGACRASPLARCRLGLAAAAPGRRRPLPRLATRRGSCGPAALRYRFAPARGSRENRECCRPGPRGSPPRSTGRWRAAPRCCPPASPATAFEVKRELLVDGGLDRGQNDGDPIEFGVSDRDLGRVVGGQRRVRPTVDRTLFSIRL